MEVRRNISTMVKLIPFNSLYAEPSRNGLMKPKRVRGVGTKIINMGELFANPRIKNVDAERAPLSDKEREKSLLRSGDLLFARQSLVLAGAGKCSVFMKDTEDVSFESHIIRVRLDKAKADPLFYYYYFSSWAGRSVIESIVEQGAGVSGIRASDLSAVFVDYLSPPDQKAIAHVLGTLDDKIELNRKMNETLEAMAGANFKSWFVDFDPVQAKAEGRKPDGMDAETAALFPDSFEDSELGKIPKGWRVGSIARCLEISGGGTPKTSIAEYWEGNIPWFSVVDAPSLSDVFVLETKKHITEEGLNNSSTRLLRIGTTIISARGTVGKLALVGLPMAMNQSCYGVNGADERGDFFTFYLLRTMVSDFQRSAHGSVFATITQSTFESVRTVIPPASATQSFDVSIENTMQRIVGNLKEAQTLRELRDTLLPRLLSGKLRIKDAEKFIEDVA